MRKKIFIMIIAIVLVLLVLSTAFAASYKGAIWTGRPSAFGIGYYCTAAQNRSEGVISTHWAKAKTWKTPSGSPVVDNASGNNRAVASTGKTHPYKGWGSYGEGKVNDGGWSTEGGFKSSAWD